MKNTSMDMCNGPLLKKIIQFTIPVMLSGVLQLLFNSADMIVAGRFAGEVPLGAVGATSSLINLLINLFIGLSVGVNVVAANYFGAGNVKEFGRTIHTAILLAIISGVILAVVGIFLSRPLLILMRTPDEVIDLSVQYMQIYFAGMPVIMIYNFGSSLLRATGDTKHPLYFLVASGIINVILNLFFVIVLKMSVAGVALATVISQVLSAALILRCLVLINSDWGLRFNKLKIHKDLMEKIALIGLPAGFQGVVFAFSNVIIQSSINSFGKTALAGNTAASNLENYVYISMNSLHQTAINFTGQNAGSGKYNRIDKILIETQILVIIVGLVLGIGCYEAGNYLLLFFTDKPDVIDYGVNRLSVICVTYALCGSMDVFVGVLRGLGKAVTPMFVSIAGVCGIRLVWIYTVFQLDRTLKVLYMSYPVSWIVTAFIHFCCYMYIRKKLFNRAAIRPSQKEI